MDTAAVKNLVENLIPFVKKTGVKAAELAPSHVRLELPHDPTNLNPMGILHAGATFTLAETTAAAMGVMAFGARVTFIAKQVEIRFRRPGKGDLVATATMTEDEAGRLVEAAQKDGKVDAPLTVEVTDRAREPVATATVLLSVRRMG